MWIIFKLKKQTITNDFKEFMTTIHIPITLKYHKEVMGRLVVIDSEGEMYIEKKEDKDTYKYTLLKYYIKQKEKK